MGKSILSRNLGKFIVVGLGPDGVNSSLDFYPPYETPEKAVRKAKEIVGNRLAEGPHAVLKIIQVVEPL